MRSISPENTTSCSGQCPVCSGRAAATGTAEGQPGSAGWPLVGWSFLVFILPIGLAAAGAVWAGGAGTRGLLGGLAGLAAGVAIAAGAHRLMFHKRNPT